MKQHQAETAGDEENKKMENEEKEGEGGDITDSDREKGKGELMENKTSRATSQQVGEEGGDADTSCWLCTAL